uniref:Dirigent protein n=1 Tax=Kadsura heteroclita TaxID=124781 RepID=A0A7U3VIA7_9MAGN|nr:dirigent protein 18 [Kadsura heteroclita]
MVATQISVLLLLVFSVRSSAFWTRMMPKMTETKLTFYMQDWETGKNPTAVPVAGTNVAGPKLLNFGTIMAIDDALTEGPNRGSKQIGRAHGIYVTSSLNGLDFHLLFSVVFTDDKYNGSSLEIQGSDRALLKQREVSVVSGTGHFRFAKGFATLETAYLDVKDLNAVIKFNITVVHLSHTGHH